MRRRTRMVGMPHGEEEPRTGTCTVRPRRRRRRLRRAARLATIAGPAPACHALRRSSLRLFHLIHWVNGVHFSKSNKHALPL